MLRRQISALTGSLRGSVHASLGGLPLRLKHLRCQDAFAVKSRSPQRRRRRQHSRCRLQQQALSCASLKRTLFHAAAGDRNKARQMLWGTDPISPTLLPLIQPKARSSTHSSTRFGQRRMHRNVRRNHRALRRSPNNQIAPDAIGIDLLAHRSDFSKNIAFH